jgi:hypothetical protein
MIKSIRRNLFKLIKIYKGNRYLANRLFIGWSIVRFSLRLLMILITFSSLLIRLKIKCKFLKNYYTIHNLWLQNDIIKRKLCFNSKIFWNLIKIRHGLILSTITVPLWQGVIIVNQFWKSKEWKSLRNQVGITAWMKVQS